MARNIPKKKSNRYVAEFTGEPLIELQSVTGLSKKIGVIEHRDGGGSPELYAGDEQSSEVEFQTANPADTAIFAARLDAMENDHTFSVHIMSGGKIPVILESWIAENVVVHEIAAGELSQKNLDEFHENTIRVTGVFTQII